MHANSKWVLNEFRKMLSEGVVGFRYVKTGGESRVALATTSRDIVPKEKQAGGYDPLNPSPTPDQTVAYWDIQASGWRSMAVDAEFIVLSSSKF